MYNVTIGKVVVAMYALIIGWGILSFLLNVMCKSMDACFLCFMMDKEHNSITKHQVYSVFEQMKETERQRKESRLNTAHSTAGASSVELSDVSHRVVSQPGAANLQYANPHCEL